MILQHAPLDDLLGLPPPLLRCMLFDTGDALELLGEFEPVTGAQEIVVALERMALREYRANLIRALEQAGELS